MKGKDQYKMMMDNSKLIKGIEKMIAGKNHPVIPLEKSNPSSKIVKEIIQSHYKNKVEIKEDNEAYHIHFKEVYSK